MKAFSVKNGLQVSLVISLLATLARIIRWEENNVWLLAANFVYIFILVNLLHVVCSLSINKFQRGKYGLHVTATVLVCACIAVAYQALFESVFGRLSIIAQLPIENDFNTYQRIGIQGFRGVVVGSLVYFITNYLHVLAEKQHAALEIAQLKQENLEARLNLLKQQISPHFLFNSLGTLRSIAPDNHTKSYVSQLANVYRYLLQHDSGHLASLENELEFVHSYLFILQERYEDALEISMDIPKEAIHKKLPPFALQILVENAIKHNVLSAEDPLKITIHVKGTGLVVENNFRPRLSSVENSGKGLKNISDRYRLLMAQEPEIVHTENTFRVILPLL